MMSTHNLLIAVAGLVCALLSYLLTGRVRAYALRTDMLDRPNERSSHQVSTPRGGGVAIVLVSLGGILASTAAGWIAAPVCAAWACGGAIVAIAGYVDDRRGLRASWRFSCHVLAAAILVWTASRLQTSAWLATILGIGPVGWGIAVLGVVWSINLFNFMDGTDGIAAAQALFFAGGSVVVLALFGADSGGLLAPVILAGSVAGFLTWNWPPARIFMGDVGSGFLGYAVSCLAVFSPGGSRTTIWTWVILHGLFFCDATVTLLVRLLRGERVYQAHRQHLYQHLARRWGSRRRVLLAAVATNGLWLLPLVIASEMRPEWAFGTAMVALVPLCLLAVTGGAGRRES